MWPSRISLMRDFLTTYPTVSRRVENAQRWSRLERKQPQKMDETRQRFSPSRRSGWRDSYGAPDQIPKSRSHGGQIYLWPPPEGGPELWGYLLKRPRTSFTPMSQDDPKALVCTYSLAFVLKMPLRSARFRHG